MADDNESDEEERAEREELQQEADKLINPPSTAEVTEPPKPKPKGGMAAFLIKKREGASSEAAPAAAPAQKQKSSPSGVSGSPSLRVHFTSTTSWCPLVTGVDPEDVRLDIDLTDVAPMSLSEEQRVADVRWIPVALESKAPAIVLAAKSNSSCLGGGAVYIVTEASETDHTIASQLYTLTPDNLETALATFSCESPSHAVRANPAYGSLLWRCKAIFKNFDWNGLDARDIKAAFSRADDPIAVHYLTVPSAPEHVTEDFQGLRLGNLTDNRDTLNQRMAQWIQRGQQWTPPSGSWPCAPIRAGDPRAKCLSSRSELAQAVNRFMRGTVSDKLMTELVTSGAFAAGLLKLARLEPAKGGVDADDDDEEAETRALLKPPVPKKKEEKKKPPKGRGIKRSGASFVDGCAMEVRAGDESDGASEEDGFEEPDDSDDDSMIASDDDVEAESEVAKKKAKAKRLAKRQKRAEAGDSAEEDAGEEKSDACDSDNSDSSDEMSDGSGSGAGSGSGDESEEEGPIVTAKDQASDMSDDDDKPKRKARAAGGKRRGAVIADSDASDDDTLANRAALFAEQQIEGAPTHGKKAQSQKMGSKTHPVAGAGRAAQAPRPKDATPTGPGTITSLFGVDGSGNRSTKAVGPPPASVPARPSRPYAQVNRERMKSVCDGHLAVLEQARAKAAKDRTGVLATPEAQTMHENILSLESSFADLVPAENGYVPKYNAVIENMTDLLGRLVHAISAHERPASSKDIAVHLDLALAASSVLLEVQPLVEQVQKLSGDLAAKATSLAGATSAASARIAVDLRRGASSA